MTRGRILPVVALAAAAVLAGCGGERGTAESAGPSRTRAVQPVNWHRLWVVGGSEADTTLLQPWRITAGRELVYVADKAALRVAAFRIADGSLAWIRGGRGSGPGEFMLPTAIAVDAQDRLWVADALNSRITVFRPDGRLHQSINLVGFPYPESLCPLREGGMMVATSAPTEPLFQISRAGVIEGRTALPWSDLSRASPLSVQKILAPTKDGCVLALTLGRGFAVLSGAGSAIYPYIESFPLPTVQEKVEDGGATVSRQVVDMRVAATSVAAAEGEIAVTPAASGEMENRLVDFYREGDGAYLRSYVTPVAFQRMARSNDLYFFLTHRDGYPMLAAVRPTVAADGAGR